MGGNGLSMTTIKKLCDLLRSRDSMNSNIIISYSCFIATEAGTPEKPFGTMLAQLNAAKPF